MGLILKSMGHFWKDWKVFEIIKEYLKVGPMKTLPQYVC